jgi:hypothetical protein
MTSTHTKFQNRSRILIRSLLVLLIALALLSVNLDVRKVAARSSEPQSAVVLQTTGVPMMIGTSRILNNGLGKQSDPHIDGDLVTYTDDDLMGTTTVRYFDLATNTDHLVPGNGANSQSEVSAGRIAFTESTAAGSQVVLFDIATQTRTVMPGYGFSKPTVGGNYLFFEDRSSTEYMHPVDIGGYLIPSDHFYRQTNDQFPDTNPALSPAGNMMLYQRCQTEGADCTFQGFVLTDPGIPFPGFSIPLCPKPSQYDMNNEYVLAYTSDKDGETDIYIQTIVGINTETHLVIPGEQRNVSISGNLVSFESPVQLDNVLEYDIFVYDLNTGKLYQVTKTPEDEGLSDISISNGFARIVYGAPSASANDDVVAFKFRPPGAIADQINDGSALLDSFQLPAGTANSLNAKLRDALAAIAASDTATACTALSSFISACQAHSGKKLTVDQATQLINSANLIKFNLGCQ